MLKYDHPQKDKYNAGLVLMASVFLTYGIAELFDAYGFLAVFIGSLVGRLNFKYEDVDSNISKLPHLFSDQIEKVCMAVFLLWLGYYCMSGGLDNLNIAEFLLALSVVIFIRPVISYICLYFTDGSRLDHFAISFLGIRGIGSLYYIAYAHEQFEFDNVDSVWRIIIVTIIISIFIHGISSNFIMNRIHNNKK